MRIIRYTPQPGNRPEKPVRQAGLKPFAATRLPEQRRGRGLAGTFSIGAHLAVIAALVWGQHFAFRTPPAESAPSLTLVSIKPDPKPPGPPEATETASSEVADIAPPPPPQVNAPVLVIARTAPDSSDLLSDSQIAGAARVGEGGSGGGGGCDTARLVQQVLRRDPRVRAAVAEADRVGKASMLWNGDWIRTGGQEGKGLAVVRQAIIWEVAFEPEACRNARMQGMVLLSLADGRTRFAIGAGSWRWSDLLGLRGVIR